MVLSISYDLCQPGRDYGALYNVIKSAPGWIRAMDSFWLISTTEPVEHWFNSLMQAIDKNDNLLILDITNQSRQGWMEKAVWEWLQKHESSSYHVES